MSVYSIPAAELFHLFPRQNLYLTCNEAGDILDLPYADNFNYPFWVNQFRARPNLRNFFEIDPASELADPWEGFRVFPGKGESVGYELFEPFYCCLPIVVLRIMKVSKDRYSGIVYLSDIVPHLHPEKNIDFLFVDGQDRIAGFNHAFYSRFSDRVAGPLEMLRAPAGDFFTPTPGRFQRDRVEQALAEAGRGFSIRETWDFERGPIRAAGFFPAELPAAATPAGLRLEAPSDQILAAVIFRNSMDTGAQDFLLEISTDTPERGGPLFFLSDRPLPPGVTPDLYGYTVSWNAEGSEIYLKKSGLMVHCAEAFRETGPAQTRFVFGKIGNSLFLKRNGAVLIGFFDSFFAAHAGAALSVGFRPGAAGVIRRAALWTRKTREAGAGRDDPLIVNLKTEREGFLSLNRFYTYDLNTKFPRVAGFFAQDVTPLQLRANRFSMKYTSEVKKREALSRLLEAERQTAAPLVGAHPAFSAVRDQALTAARSAATILIEGPTGTGKEMLARFIHAQSGFNGGPFVKVDCATLPATLMESELFGHEAGAFTGAAEAKPGLFEMAEGGTLFLDEVGNLSVEVQAKLLQFLQDFSLTRLGGRKSLRLRLRVVAASNVRLKEMSGAGTFREDLYFRLAVISLSLPSLRERPEDIPLLCAHFLKEFNRESPTGISRISADGYRKLMSHTWPGNVRELKNVLQRAFVFCGGEEIRGDHIVLGDAGQSPKGKRKRVPGRPAFHLLSKMEPAALLAVVEKNRGNLHRIAREVGVTRRALYCHFRKIGLDLARFRG